MIESASRTLDVELTTVRGLLLRDLLLLTKPRVVTMVLITTLVGFYVGAQGGVEYVLLLKALLGTGLAAAGTLALNQYVERDLDARMMRTCNRPLPSGRLRPIDALAFGSLLVTLGLAVLSFLVNALAGAVTAATVVIYLFGYTPLKQRTSLCSIVGAIPGALPPVTGWVAARGEFTTGAWVLFGILFLWQLPHSLAIARLYTEDYARAGFRLLPVVDREGSSTERQIVTNCAALLVVGLMPTLLGLAGPVYFVSALILGCGFLGCGIFMAHTRSPAAARRVLLASLVYLPTLLAIMAADKITS